MEANVRVKDLILSLGLVVVAGCAVDGSGSGSVPPTPSPSGNDVSMRQYLVRPRDVDLGTSSTFQLTAERLYNGDDTDTTTLQLTSGTVTLSTLGDGSIVVDKLVASLGDITLSPSAMPPDGLHLTNIKVTLQQESYTETSWTSDGTAAAASGSIDLDLDWSLVATDGSVLPLATQHITGIPLSLSVSSDASGKITLSAKAAQAGVFYEWSGIVRLSNLNASLTN
jgi:hypothetical protein